MGDQRQNLLKSAWTGRSSASLAARLLIPAGLLAAALAFYWQFAASGSVASAVPPAQAVLCVNEVMSANRTAIADAQGRYPDYIELINASDAPLDVTGYTVTDGKERLVPFTFPKQVLAPGEVVLIFASGDLKNVPGYPYHAPFRLSAQGERITVKNPDGAQVDAVEVPALLPNQAYARNEQGAYAKTLHYTPGLSNTEANHRALSAGRGSASGSLVLSELMPGNVSHAKTAAGACPDYIELHNTGATAIRLQNYGLSDDENEPQKWRFPDVTLEPGAYLLVYASGENRAEDGELHANFRLSSGGETVVLADGDGRVIDRVTYEPLSADRAYSRLSSDEWTADLPATPGAPNDASGIARTESALRAVNPLGVCLTEAMASGRKPNALKTVEDWVELYNFSGQTVDLSGCGLSDDPSRPRKWQFPQGATLQAGQYLAVTLNGQDRYDVQKNAYQANFRISFAQGETLTLSLPDGQIVDRLPMLGQRSAVSYGRASDADGYFYFAEPTAGAANAGARYEALAQDVQFSQDGGWVDGGSLTLALSAEPDATIRYTLDATEPSEQSPVYESPIAIVENTVVRAKAYRANCLPSLTGTRSFLFGERHTLPVVSLVTDPSYLYDEKIGIYTMGANQKLKYPYKGANFWKEWERAANVEFFGVDGSVRLSQGAGLSLQGQYSRMEDQKAFKITARNAYGKNRFNDALFPNRTYTSYKSFLLRASGQDFNKTRFRDAVLVSLADQTPVMYQDALPVAVYLNGAYFGHYNMRERIHKYSIAQWENWTDVDRIDIVKANDNVKQGTNDDYAAFLKWLKKNGCKTSENLQKVADMVDIDNYLDYVALEMYIGNTDLLNVKRYRSTEGDNRWRWVLFDTDWAFYTDTDSYRRWLDPAGAGSGKKTDNTLFVQLMKNPEIKQKFLKRFGELMHVSWRSDLVVGRIDAYYKLLEPEMPRQVKRWGGSVKTWTARVAEMRNYAKARPKKMLGYIKRELGFNNDQMREYFSDIMNDLGM